MALVVLGVGCGGGGDDEQATPTEVQLVAPDGGREPVRTTTTTSTTTTTTTTTAPTTTTTSTEPPATEPDPATDGGTAERPARSPAPDLVAQAGQVCEAVRAEVELDVALAGEADGRWGLQLAQYLQRTADGLRPLADADSTGRVTVVVQGYDLAAAFSGQSGEAYGSGDAAAGRDLRDRASDALLRPSDVLDSTPGLESCGVPG